MDDTRRTAPSLGPYLDTTANLLIAHGDTGTTAYPTLSR